MISNMLYKGAVFYGSFFGFAAIFSKNRATATS